MTIVLAFVVVMAMCTIVIMTTVAFLLTVIGGMMTGVPFVPAPRRTTEVLMRLCPLDASSHFYDLGCGDGRIVAAMAGRYPAATCIGVEMAPLPSILLWLRQHLSPHQNMRFLYRDFGAVDLSDATHIYLYLFPALMERLLPKLEKELRPGTRVVSCDFVFKGRQPNQIVPLGESKHTHKLYVYDF